MAERRMFTKKITDSDSFVEMPAAAQALYMHLCQSADDDGFTNQIQMSMFKAHANPEDLKMLIDKRFILTFDSGVVVIKHWRLHNALRKDRYVKTCYQEEWNSLYTKEDGTYTLRRLEAEQLPQGRIYEKRN